MTFLFLMLACDAGVGTEECVDNGECAEGQACVDGACATVECLESDQCSIGQFCDPRNFTCRNGCEVDDDCLAGQECNTQTHECQDSACRSAELDCNVGEMCDQVTGQCYEYPGSICEKSCDSTWGTGCSGNESCEAFVTNWDPCSNKSQCDANEACDDFIVAYASNANECPEGSTFDSFWGYCIMGLCHEDLCMPTCNPSNADSCPAGFQCLSDGLGGGTCYGECGYFKDNGYL